MKPLKVIIQIVKELIKSDVNNVFHLLNIMIINIKNIKPKEI